MRWLAVIVSVAACGGGSSSGDTGTDGDGDGGDAPGDAGESGVADDAPEGAVWSFDNETPSVIGAIDDTVYVVTQDAFAFPGTIYAVAASGDGATELASVDPGQRLRGQHVVTSERITWPEFGDDDAADRLRWIPRQGAAPALLAEHDRGGAYLVDGGGGAVHWGLGGEVLTVGIDGQTEVVAAGCHDPFVYANGAFYCYADAAVNAITADGGITVLADETAAVAMAHDGQELYWISLAQQLSIHAVPLGGGQVRTLLTDASAGATSYLWCIDASGEDLLLARRTAVLRLPKSGGEPQVVPESDELTGCPHREGNAIWFGDVVRDTLTPNFVGYVRRIVE